MQIKRLAILGSTGSIGTQSLEVVDQFPDRLVVEVLVAFRNVELLEHQARKYNPKYVVIGDEELYAPLRDSLSDTNIKVLAGDQSITDIVALDSVDTVIAAIVGYSGLRSTYNALRHGKEVALANKETLVVAGDLMTRIARETGANILPVDSEHSALFQCLVGEPRENIEKMILTASGGPFRTWDSDRLKSVTKSQALKHPNWSMGAKITIDSATLMNKGLEIIEAKWLFDIEPEKIDVIVHPQSIVHSMVQFVDGSIKAQCGVPDMKLPIQYALSYPDRWQNDFRRFSFFDYSEWTFEPPRWDDFRCLAYAKNALLTGGISACVLNAANEIAVEAFLNEKIDFLGIPRTIEYTMLKIMPNLTPSMQDYLDTDKEARNIAKNFITTT